MKYCDINAIHTYYGRKIPFEVPYIKDKQQNAQENAICQYLRCLDA